MLINAKLILLRRIKNGLDRLDEDQELRRGRGAMSISRLPLLTASGHVPAEIA
jgi:hypothetical protein